MKQLVFIIPVLLLVTACKKKSVNDAVSELNYAGDASIYAAIKFSSNRPTKSLYWDFGDNATSVDKEPTHQYIKEGNYTVKLIIDRQDTVIRKLFIGLGLYRIGRVRLWSRKLIMGGGQSNKLSDTTFALKMVTDNIIILPSHNLQPFNKTAEVYFQKVEDNLITYAAFDSVSNTQNALIYNAASDVVNFSRVYESNRLEYTSK